MAFIGVPAGHSIVGQTFCLAFLEYAGGMETTTS